ncbi:MAG: ABC transporter permease subunit [Chloroflexota bacterium]|nr:ABC transporter permease subunit [Chloroflexota bacterium]
MTWLVWRQHRYELLGLLIGGVLVAVGLVYGADLAVRVRAQFGVDSCNALPSACVSAAVQAGDRLQPFRWLVILLFFLPAIAGSFVGGPLFARDLERGTHRLVWTQGITRMRWGTAKLISVLAAAAAAAVAVALFGGRASTINGTSAGANAFQNFDIEGPAFVSYVVFAIVVAAFAGTFSRRILPGMFVGLLLFGAVRLGVEFELRPTVYEPPITVVRTSGGVFPQEMIVFLTAGQEVPAGPWITHTEFVDAESRVVPEERAQALLSSFRPTSTAHDSLAYLASKGVSQRVYYQPADRYWRFQWTEALLFLVLSATLGASTLLLLSRRDA